MAKKDEEAAVSAQEGKLKALQAAMAKIEKDFGKGSIMKLGDDSIENVEVIPPGVDDVSVMLAEQSLGGGFRFKNVGGNTLNRFNAEEGIHFVNLFLQLFLISLRQAACHIKFLYFSTFTEACIKSRFYIQHIAMLYKNPSSFSQFGLDGLSIRRASRSRVSAFFGALHRDMARESDDGFSPSNLARRRVQLVKLANLFDCTLRGIR